MDWNTFISIFSQIATLITILLVYFTLVEMRNQRKASQKPDLIIPKSNIHGYVYVFSNDESGLPIPRLWSNEEIKHKVEEWRSQSILTAYNVGFGVAKNIELIWTVDYDKTFQQIKDYCYRQSIPIILQLSDKELIVEDKKLPADAQYQVFEVSPLHIKHDFLLPVSIKSESLMFPFPGTFSELFSIQMYLRSRYSSENFQDPKASLEFDNMPVRLEVHYDDLENFHYVKKFNVRYSVIVHSFPPIYKTNLFSMSCEFIEESKAAVKR